MTKLIRLLMQNIRAGPPRRVTPVEPLKFAVAPTGCRARCARRL